MQVEDMRCVANEVSDLLKILANPNRLMALCELAQEELSVGELARRLGVRDQVMSQQLSILRANGFVEKRRDSQTIYYALARDDIRAIIETLYELYCAEERSQSSS